MRSPPVPALVIGGGVVGHACALSLQRRGCEVTLVDPGLAEMAPSWGNAGHIAAEQVEPLASPAMLRTALRRHYAFGGALDIRNPLRHARWIAGYLRACAPARHRAGRTALRGLLAESLPAWRRLAHAIGQPELLREDGHWVCWESPAGAARGRRAWAAADTGTASFADLPESALAGLRAALPARIAGGIAFRGTAQIADLARLAAALADAYARAGGIRRRTRIEALAARGRRVRALTREGEWIDADRILVCAGIGSRGLMAPLGLRVPLLAERGYHAQWRRHDWPDLPPVVFEDRAMIVTRFAGGLRAAGFVEYAEAGAPPDPGKWRRLRRHVSQLGLPVHGEPALWFGARPTLPDYLPALGRCEGFGNLYCAFGHQHLGLTLAAVTGELLGALCAGEAGAVDLAPFDLRRFG